MTIDSLQTLHSALSGLHSDHDLLHIALSSIPLPASLVASLGLPPPPEAYTRLLPDSPLPWYHPTSSSAPEDDILVCFASTFANEGLETYAFALPTVQGYFSGVGDLFSAMVLAHFPGTGERPLHNAVSRALMIVQQVLLRTHIYSLSHSATQGEATPRPLHSTSVIPTDNELDAAQPVDAKDPKRKAKRMRLRELRLIQERQLLQGTEGWPGKKLEWQKLGL